MFGPNRPMPPFPPRPPMRGFMPGRAPNGMMGIPRQMGPTGMNRGGGGLLARLLGRTGARNIGNMSAMGQLANPSNVAGAGNAIQQFANPNNLTGLLTNVQKALKTAESVVPMVQQYGPLVRNLPAMWKLYSEFKATDNNDSENTNETETEEPKNNEGEGTEKKESSDQESKSEHKKETTESSQSKEQKKNNRGTSTPKLYL
ncbi:VrrA/YqfQ family protein [Sutcliffiella sp. NC1]|uniref:VrrA/YqfQ family protein n=1 Tax=Sutcliffiella sp. NC1 TaxID=3004096 RepID=UPI0022DD6E9D|nr:VrrA/YqfQ family protein [Sutcliffiella sp. NC1]WBL13837.1 VrrA/YqfQ family protein [Sutcliffiella sp. NC1]